MDLRKYKMIILLFDALFNYTQTLLIYVFHIDSFLLLKIGLDFIPKIFSSFWVSLGYYLFKYRQPIKFDSFIVV
jgi:ABC-type enterochelin transport system permease subunit